MEWIDAFLESHKAETSVTLVFAKFFLTFFNERCIVKNCIFVA